MSADPALVARLADRVAFAGGAPGPGTVLAALAEERVVVPADDLLDMVVAVSAELVGAGPLQALLDQPAVSDVLVNGPDEVWVDRGDGLVRTPVGLGDEAAVRRLAQRLAAAAGRRLDVASPTVDGRLPDGSRLHAVLPPVSPSGTLLSLRVTRRRSFSLSDLVGCGSVAEPAAEVLLAAVVSRLSFVVTGGTGTGKTTVLAALLSEVPVDERIVLVEDAGELSPIHPHVVRLEARQANAEGQGTVPLKRLVREALRMRPDRLVVGEVRGAEVVELLAALNTGHEGGCGTLHASAAAALPARVEALALAAGLGREAAHSQLGAGVDLVVHLVRDRTGRRRLAEIGCLTRGASGLVEVVPALTVAADGRVAEGGSAERLVDLLGGRR